MFHLFGGSMDTVMMVPLMGKECFLLIFYFYDIKEQIPKLIINVFDLHIKYRYAYVVFNDIIIQQPTKC